MVAGSKAVFTARESTQPIFIRPIPLFPQVHNLHCKLPGQGGRSDWVNSLIQYSALRYSCFCSEGKMRLVSHENAKRLAVYDSS